MCLTAWAPWSFFLSSLIDKVPVSVKSINVFNGRRQRASGFLVYEIIIKKFINIINLQVLIIRPNFSTNGNARIELFTFEEAICPVFICNHFFHHLKVVCFYISFMLPRQIISGSLREIYIVRRLLWRRKGLELLLH